jgi:hypothetical protein
MLPASVRIAPPIYDSLSAWGIGGLSVVVAVAFVVLLSRGQPRLRAGLAIAGALVMHASAFAATTGRLARFDIFPPPMLLMILSVFVVGFAVGLSKIGQRAADTLPLATLIGLQAFRLPLEVVMHRAGTLGIMPPQLSFGGYQFDIVTGATAGVVYGLTRSGVAVPRWALWAWNVWGWWCLFVIAVIAVTTSPVLRLFGDDPRDVNTWVLYFPYVWLPVVLVTVAIAGHVMVTRTLRRAS